MDSMWVIKTVGMLVISFIIGMAFFFFTNPSSIEQRKKQLESVLSLIINFVIFVWISKIILNLSLFVSDPLAVLAYPSHSTAFYSATAFLVINIIYRVRRHNMNVMAWLEGFTPVFLAAAFSYEFFAMLESAHLSGIIQLIFLMGLLVVYLILDRKVSSAKRALLLMTVWALGQFILSFIDPQVAVFGYRLSRWFSLAIVIVFAGYIFYNQRKQVL